MAPLTDIMGFDLGAPHLWPMGIVSGRPYAIDCMIGTPWRFALEWDDRDRLTSFRFRLMNGCEVSRDEYRWNGALLDRIVHFDASLGGEYEYERIWTRDESNRPIEIRTAFPEEPHFDGEASMAGWISSFRPPPENGPVEAWAWSDDGRSVRITESSKHGVLCVSTVRFDEAGRLLHLESDRAIDKLRRVVDVKWDSDGRIHSAQERRGESTSTVTFRWEGARLAAQTNGLHAGDLWVYRYPPCASSFRG